LIRQGKFVSCPLDIHKGPFFCFEDNYQYIFGEETDKKIHDNCNVDLFKQIDGTKITHGVMKYVEGNRWMNGMICYNQNSICIRNEDNGFGQPGFLSAVYFYDRLGVEIMKQYIVPELIRAVKENRINTSNGWGITRTIITDTYDNVHKSKIAMLNGANIAYVNRSTLFEDAPREEKLVPVPTSPDDIQSLMHVIDEKDRKIDALEKRVESLSVRLNMVLTKITELEDIFLDVSIRMNKPD